MESSCFEGVSKMQLQTICNCHATYQAKAMPTRVFKTLAICHIFLPPERQCFATKGQRFATCPYSLALQALRMNGTFFA
jgi:hypothetical protein